MPSQLQHPEPMATRNLIRCTINLTNDVTSASFARNEDNWDPHVREVSGPPITARSARKVPEAHGLRWHSQVTTLETERTSINHRLGGIVTPCLRWWKWGLRMPTWSVTRAKRAQREYLGRKSWGRAGHQENLQFQ